MFDNGIRYYQAWVDFNWHFTNKNENSSEFIESACNFVRTIAKSEFNPILIRSALNILSDFPQVKSQLASNVEVEYLQESMGFLANGTKTYPFYTRQFDRLGLIY